MNKCKLCGQEKTWKGDDTECPFKNGNRFDLNWNCGQIAKIRELCNLAETENTFYMNYQYCDDQKYVSINVDDVALQEPALCLWVSWYKNRGGTDQMWLLPEFGSPREVTFDDIQRIYDFYISKIEHNEVI